MLLSISIVTYYSCTDILQKTISSLKRSIREGGVKGHLYLISNCDSDQGSVSDSEYSNSDSLTIEYINGQGNIGYGRGHNIAVAKTESQYHLVLNPDVFIESDAISKALNYLSANADCGLLAPAAYWPDGNELYLCKSYPSFLDLGLRGIDNRHLRKYFSSRLARYEMKDMVDAGCTYPDPPIISGCFMLFRTDVLKALGGFDPRFFLYFEDFDISMRAAGLTRLAYVPSVRIVHYGGYAARKGAKHIALFAHSALKFFNKHGWKWY